MSKNKISKNIIIDELIEQSHIERVEDVIFWALESYAKNKNTNGSVVAYAIVERIKDAERKNDTELVNQEKVESLNL